MKTLTFIMFKDKAEDIYDTIYVRKQTLEHIVGINQNPHNLEGDPHMTKEKWDAMRDCLQGLIDFEYSLEKLRRM